jgi:hypothetical protein
MAGHADQHLDREGNGKRQYLRRQGDTSQMQLSLVLCTMFVLQQSRFA